MIPFVVVGVAVVVVVVVHQGKLGHHRIRALPPKIRIKHHAAASAVVAAAVARAEVEELGAEGKLAQAWKGPYRLEIPGLCIVAQAAAGNDRVLAVEGIFR